MCCGGGPHWMAFTMREVRRLDLVGKRFGRWTVLRCAASRWNDSCWLCRCDCGAERVVTGGRLASGRSRSCGCLRGAAVAEKITRHGACASGRAISEYTAWQSLKQRCTDSTRGDFSRYGGRGITVCARWRHSFEAFLDDMGLKPGPEYSIDRIDNNGNYEPGNCRWATAGEQSSNQWNNHRLELHGISRTISEWSRVTGISRRTLYHRLERGWTVERTLTKPVRRMV
jgi:hypothetical protein